MVINCLQILDWFVQMCLAVKYIHDRKILHRDIKAQVKVARAITSAAWHVYWYKNRNYTMYMYV